MSYSIEYVTEVKRKYTPYLLKIPEVQGVGVGNSHLIIYVEKITPELREVLPKILEGVPVEIKESGKFQLFLTTTDRWRPALGGVSLGNPVVTAGTFGCLVRRDNYIFGLSNNHVIALDWGERHEARKGIPVIQPGTYDGGTEKDRIGELYYWVPVRKEEKNLVDCAIFTPDNVDIVKPEVLNIGIPTGSVEPRLGVFVRKMGRTTELTYGKITAVHATVKVHGFGLCVFEEQFIVDGSGFCAPGDSGSVVFLANDNKVVGLLFAGNIFGTAICNYATVVEKELNVSFNVGYASPESRRYAYLFGLAPLGIMVIAGLGGAKTV